MATKHEVSIPIGGQAAVEIGPASTVGNIVTANPGASRVFERYGIDYCCAGKRTLADAAMKKNIDVSALIEDLRQSAAARPADEPDWSAATMTELADHIEATHHAMLRRELPRLRAMTRKVATVHGERHPEMAQVAEVFERFADEMEQHMMKEERVLFPALRRMERAGGAAEMALDGPIAQMMAEHDDAGRAMETMRALTRGYAPPADACATFRAVLEGLHAIELDTHRHVHKENSILFPKAATRASETKPVTGRKPGCCEGGAGSTFCVPRWPDAQD